MSALDPMRYLPAPKLGFAKGVSLAYRLVAAAPQGSGEAVGRCVSQLREHAELLGARWIAREKLERSPSETRPAGHRLDKAIRALHDRLAAATLLPAKLYPEAAEAAALAASLFPEGLGFLTLRFGEKWSHANVLLKRIDEDRLAAVIDAFAGPPYLAELRLALEHYGRVLGISEAREAPTAEAWASRAEGLKQLSQLIGAYTLQVLASVDESRPETIEAAQRALQPLIEYRAANARSRGSREKPAADSPEAEAAREG